MGNMRKTRQKDAIDSEIARKDELFTASELLAQVHRRHPEIGQATVYRHLKAVARAGDVHTFMHGRTVVYSAHSRSDAHFICGKCGKREHVKVGKADFLSEVALQTGGKACHFQLDVHGMCAKCAKKEKA